MCITSVRDGGRLAAILMLFAFGNLLAQGSVSILPPMPGPCPGPCCFPAGSMSVVGVPTNGNTIAFYIDSPTGGIAGGSLVALAFSLAGIVGPCGVPLPWITNQLLIALPANLVSLGGPWFGPGIPVGFNLMIPSNPAFIGMQLGAQGAFLEPAGSIVATQGALVVIG